MTATLKKFHIAPFIFAVSVVLLYVAGVLGNAFIYKRDSDPAIIIIAAAIAIAAVYFAALFVYNFIDGIRADQKPLKRPGKKIFLFFFLVIIALWTPYFIIRFPGNYDIDTIVQIMQTYGFREATDHHPWFDTLIFSFFWRIGDGLGSNRWSLVIYVWLQMIATAATFSLALCYFRSFKRSKVFTILALIFYGAYPVIPMFTNVMAKDMLHGWIFVLFFLLYVELLRGKGKILEKKKFVVFLIVTAILLMMTKKTGLYCVVLSAIPAFFIIKKVKLRFICSVAAAVVFFVVIWQGLIIGALGVKKGEEAEMLSVPAQQTALYIREHYDKISEDEWSILRGVYDTPERLREVYEPNRADNTKGLWKNSVDKEAKSRYYSWYIQKALGNKAIFAAAFFGNAYGAFCVDRSGMGTESLLYYWDNVASEDDVGGKYEEFFSKNRKNNITKDEIHNLISGTYRPTFAGKTSRAFDKIYLKIISATAPAFSKVLFVLWLPLLTLIYAIRVKSIRMICMQIPILVTSLIIMAGPIVLPRYMVVSVYLAPILLFTTTLVSAKRGK